MGKKRDGAARKRQVRVVVGGVRTQAAVTVRRVAAKRRKAVAVASAEEGGLVGRCGGDDGEGGCYLRLRSRRLYFMAAAVVSSREPLGTPGAEAPSSSRAVELLAGSVEAAVAGTGISRRASTASSADAGARERTQSCGGAGEVCSRTQAGEDPDEESSVGDSGCGRGRRETTPSSRPPGDSSDAESNQEAEAEQKKRRRRRRRRRRISSTTSEAARTTRSIRTPPPAAAEIEEFLAAAERAEAERFAAKYNFDVVRGVPLDAGRFEWTAVGSG